MAATCPVGFGVAQLRGQILATSLVAAAGAAWTGYRQPAFLLQLATAAWLCN